MNKRVVCLLTLVFAANAAPGVGQSVAFDEDPSSFVSPAPAPPLPLPRPEPPAVSPAPERRNVTVGPCDTSGCWTTDGTRYNRVGGGTLMGPDGKACQYVGGGLPLACP